MMRKHLDCTTQVIGDDQPNIFLVGVQRHDAIDYHEFSIIVLFGLKHDLFLFECANTRLLQQRNQQTNRSPAYQLPPSTSAKREVTLLYLPDNP